MTSQFESHVAEGLNDYRFVATLHIQHPATGGSLTVFVGLIAKQCCELEVPPSTLRRLGNAGITVRLDYYRDETELELDVEGRIEH